MVEEEETETEERDFAPRAWGFRRCDSERRRRSSRSCFRREGASSGRGRADLEGVEEDSVVVVVVLVVGSGGREDCEVG